MSSKDLIPCRAVDMIRVLKLSGEELVTVRGRDMQTVSSLKWHLRSLFGMPMCMQKLVQNCCILENASVLSAPSDVQLVIVAASAERTEMKYVAHALLDACSRGDFEIASALFSVCSAKDWRRLFTAGADAAAGSKAFASLMLACDRGHVEIASKAFASLMLACDRGHVEIANILLEVGVNKDSASIVGDTPLMRACRKGHTEVVRLLVAAGANVDFIGSIPRIGQNPTQQGRAEKNNVEMLGLLEVELVDEHLDPADKMNRGSKTALMHACMKGHVEIVRILAQAGANCDLKSINLVSETALMLASCAGHVEAARVLLEHGAQRDLKDNRGNTALMCACDEGHVGIARLLLEAGADKDLKNNRGKTALTCARDQNHVELVQLLEDAARC